MAIDLGRGTLLVTVSFVTGVVASIALADLSTARPPSAVVLELVNETRAERLPADRAELAENLRRQIAEFQPPASCAVSDAAVDAVASLLFDGNRSVVLSAVAALSSLDACAKRSVPILQRLLRQEEAEPIQLGFGLRDSVRQALANITDDARWNDPFFTPSPG